MRKYGGAFAMVFLLNWTTSCSSEKGIVLQVTGVETDSEIIAVTYNCRNNLNEAIWICAAADVSGNRIFQCEILGKDELKLSIRSVSVPENIDLEEPIWTKYVRIKQGESHGNTIRIPRPVREALFFPPEGAKAKTFDGPISKFRLEVGCYRNSELIGMKKSLRRDDSTDDTLILSCFLNEQIEETVLTAIVEKSDL